MLRALICRILFERSAAKQAKRVMRHDLNASTAADPAQRGVESDPRCWLARSLACAQTCAQIELRTHTNDSKGPFAGGRFYTNESETV